MKKNPQSIDDAIELFSTPDRTDARIVRIVTLTVPYECLDSVIACTALSMAAQNPPVADESYTPRSQIAGRYDVTVAVHIRRVDDITIQ